MTNRSNVNLLLPDPPPEGPTQTYLYRLIRQIEQVFYAITAVRNWVVSTLIVQDMKDSSYTLVEGQLYVDDSGIVRLWTNRIAVVSGSSATASVGTVTVSTS